MMFSAVGLHQPRAPPVSQSCRCFVPECAAFAPPSGVGRFTSGKNPKAGVRARCLSSNQTPAASTTESSRPTVRPQRQCPPRPLVLPAAAWGKACVNPAPCPDSSASCKYSGLPPEALEQAFRSDQPGLLEGLAACTTEMNPSNAAQLLRRLQAELPPTLHDLAPTGDCVLVAITPGLLPLLERASECCESALLAGQAQRGACIARAALCLLSGLQFGSAGSAERYAALGVRCKQALKAAYDAGADILQEDVIELYAACARADNRLWLTPYFGHRWACAVDDFITAGWSSGELAVSFTEAHSTLTGRGRLVQVERLFVRLVQATLRHPLSLAQVRRVLGAARKLPVEMSIQLALNARSEPTNDWHTQLLQRQEQLLALESKLKLRHSSPHHLSAATISSASKHSSVVATRQSEGAAMPSGTGVAAPHRLVPAGMRQRA